MSDLKDGETTTMQGSAKEPYTLRNLGGSYDCSCPAWRNQSHPIDLRTCKHLKKLRGEAAEVTRCGAHAAGKPARSRKTSKEQAAKKAAAEKAKPDLLLAHSWDNDQDVTGWWISEKLDGVRAYWDGQRFISRLGNIYHAPEWFTEGLPGNSFDGELWMGRGQFQETVSVVRRKNGGDRWKEVRFRIFDAPEINGTCETRWEVAKMWLEANSAPYAEVVEQYPCEGISHLQLELARIEAVGGEGLMLREPGSDYIGNRSTTLLKVKSFFDDEATVVGHTAGRGRHKERTGALRVKRADGLEFSVGTGLSDQERESPPVVGETITYRYQELTKAGVPRFPSYVGIRIDA